MGTILGDRGKSYRLDKNHAKDIAVHRNRGDISNVSEGTLPSFLRSKKQRSREIPSDLQDPGHVTL